MLTEIRPSYFCWNGPFAHSWKNGFRCWCSWIWPSSFLSQLLQLTWKLLHLQLRGSNHMSIMAPVQCKIQKGSLNPLPKQPVSQYCNFHMVSDWISVKEIFSAKFCGTVQVGLVKASLSFSGFNTASKQHGRNKEKKKFRKTFHCDYVLPLFSVPLYSPQFPIWRGRASVDIQHL